MAKIGLMDVDGHNWPNLPLMKLSAWHKAKGDNVDWWWGLGHYDCVYASKVFDFSPDDRYLPADTIKGGTGYGLDGALPDDVEHTCPDYGLYRIDDIAYGFLTRGCPRRCPFCIVSDKEGAESHKVAELSEFWRGQRNIKLLDPNILAAKEAEDLLVQLAESKAYVDFTQGLDIRLLDEARASLIRKCKIQTIHFSWDNPEQDLIAQFEQAKKWLKYDFRRLSVYVLTNFNSTHAEDIYRVNTLRRLGYTPYVMIYNKTQAPRETRLLQRYVNNKVIFRSCERFEDYNPKVG